MKSNLMTFAIAGAFFLALAAAASAGCVSIPNTNASSCSYTAPEGEAQPSTAPQAPEFDADKLDHLYDRRDSINDNIGRLKDRRSNHVKGSDKRKSINSKIRSAKDRRGNVNDRIDEMHSLDDAAPAHDPFDGSDRSHYEI